MNTFARTLAVAALALSVRPACRADRRTGKPAPVTAIARTASYITTADGVQLYKDWGRRTARS